MGATCIQAEEEIPVNEGFARSQIIHMPDDYRLFTIPQFIPGSIIVCAEVMIPSHRPTKHALPLRFEGDPRFKIAVDEDGLREFKVKWKDFHPRYGFQVVIAQLFMGDPLGNRWCHLSGDNGPGTFTQ